MLSKRPSGKFIALMLLTFTQLPFAVYETLKISCIITTRIDYAVFWDWKEIPLDERVRYCNGGGIPFRSDSEKEQVISNN